MKQIFNLTGDTNSTVIELNGITSVFFEHTGCKQIQML